jgi:hypothetical protein
VISLTFGAPRAVVHAVPLPDGRPVTLGRAEFEALPGKRRKRVWVMIRKASADAGAAMTARTSSVGRMTVFQIRIVGHTWAGAALTIFAIRVVWAIIYRPW